MVRVVVEYARLGCDFPPNLRYYISKPQTEMLHLHGYSIGLSDTADRKANPEKTKKPSGITILPIAAKNESINENQDEIREVRRLSLHFLLFGSLDAGLKWYGREKSYSNEGHRPRTAQ